MRILALIIVASLPFGWLSSQETYVIGQFTHWSQLWRLFPACFVMGVVLPFLGGHWPRPVKPFSLQQFTLNPFALSFVPSLGLVFAFVGLSGLFFWACGFGPGYQAPAQAFFMGSGISAGSCSLIWYLSQRGSRA